MKKGYLIVDIGTGNTRVGIVSVSGEILAVETCDTKYYEESIYPDGTAFDPCFMWEGILELAKRVLKRVPDIEIAAITSTSQREGVVLIDKNGDSLIGLPNIDNRGKEWEMEIENPDRVYELTGRWVNTVFPALKLRGLKERQRDIWDKTSTFTSISDWICYKFSGVLTYEPSQASETLLFDVREGRWSEELCNTFGINSSFLPPIKGSGSVIGKIRPALAKQLKLSEDVQVVVGGADTELAIKGTQAETGDIVIISGTTIPIAKVNDEYLVDKLQRCWVSRHVEANQFVVETNPGAAGLNYQRLKNIFFPDKSYDEVEDEALKVKEPKCIGSFSTWVFDKKTPLFKTGFLLDAPVHQDIKNTDFVFAILFDIACSIKYNYDALMNISPSDKSYVLGCGGGFQGNAIPQFVADLLQKDVLIKEGFRQASIMGGISACNEALGWVKHERPVIRTVKPSGDDYLNKMYHKWLEFRNKINNM
jgi:autoinducer 2 (AI-2) kinase